MRKLSEIRKGFFILLVSSILFNAGKLYSQEPDLLQTIRDNDFTAAKALIASGADVNQEDELTYLTPLMLSVDKNNIEMVKTLIKSGADINKKYRRSGYTPLMMALNDHKPELAKFLISEGADIKTQANDGTTALIIAAGRSREVFDLLLAKGADLNAKNDRGIGVFTNCFMGIMSENLTTDFAEYLLSLGANIDEENTFGSYAGYTPLFWAILYDEEKLVDFLLNKGADPAHTAENGKTPLSIAKEGGNEKIILTVEAVI